MAIHVRLMGAFQVLDGDRGIGAGAWESRSSADLVKLLALAPEQRLIKDLVLEALWPQLDGSAASAALHKAASIARRVLGPGRIVLKQGEVALTAGEVVTTDVLQFEAAARRAIAAGDAKACASAAALYGGELLPGDRYAEWTHRHRERLAARHADLLRRAGAWEQLVEQDPLDERAHLELMAMYADAGNRIWALRQFWRLRQILAEQSISPSPEAMQLYERLARGPAVHAPVPSLDDFVGRQLELARARTCIRRVGEGRGHTLLVHGDAGSGKTTLCERVLVTGAQDGATTLRGTAYRDRPGAYAPVVEAIDHLMLARPDLAMSLPEGTRKVLARLATTSPLEPDDEARAIPRHRALSAVGHLLAAAARERPVILFLDDLADSDEATLDLVHAIAQLTRTHRVLLLLTAPNDPPPAFARIRASLLAHRALSEIALTPIPQDEIGSGERFA